MCAPSVKDIGAVAAISAMSVDIRVREQKYVEIMNLCKGYNIPSSRVVHSNDSCKNNNRYECNS